MYIRRRCVAPLLVPLYDSRSRLTSGSPLLYVVLSLLLLQAVTIATSVCSVLLLLPLQAVTPVQTHEHEPPPPPAPFLLQASMSFSSIPIDTQPEEGEDATTQSSSSPGTEGTAGTEGLSVDCPAPVEGSIRPSPASPDPIGISLSRSVGQKDREESSQWELSSSSGESARSTTRYADAVQCCTTRHQPFYTCYTCYAIYTCYTIHFALQG